MRDFDTASRYTAPGLVGCWIEVSAVVDNSQPRCLLLTLGDFMILGSGDGSRKVKKVNRSAATGGVV